MSSDNNPSGEIAGSTDLLPLCDPLGLAPLVTVLAAEQVLEIARLCLVDIMEKTNLIVHCADAKNWTEAATYVHDIKSSAGQLGALRLQDLAIRLEHDCKNESGNNAAKLVAEFKDVAHLTQTTYDDNKIQKIIEQASEA